MVCKTRQSYSLGEPESGSEVRNPQASGCYAHPAALDYLADHGAMLVGSVYELLRSLRRHRHEQAAARLRVIERQEIVGSHPVGDHAAIQVLPVALEPTGIPTLGAQRHGALPHRHAAATYDRSDAARLQHLGEMSEEAVARDVRGGGDPDLAQGVAGSLVQSGGRLDGVLDLSFRDEVPLEGRRQNP